jgi:hypothetical protein
VFAGRAAGDEELGLGGVPDEGADDGGGGHFGLRIADCGLRDLGAWRVERVDWCRWGGLTFLGIFGGMVGK